MRLFERFSLQPGRLCHAGSRGISRGANGGKRLHFTHVLCLTHTSSSVLQEQVLHHDLQDVHP
eukprot:11803381-Alexandrium_andersonii.AAC.1